MNAENKCAWHSDYWHKEADGFYCLSSSFDFRVHNSITMMIRADERTEDFYRECVHCETSGSPEMRCRFLVLEQRQIGPHLYRCECESAIKEAALAKKLEEL